jgi:hypothetical protein
MIARGHGFWGGGGVDPTTVWTSPATPAFRFLFESSSESGIEVTQEQNRGGSVAANLAVPGQHHLLVQASGLYRISAHLEWGGSLSTTKLTGVVSIMTASFDELRFATGAGVENPPGNWVVGVTASTVLSLKDGDTLMAIGARYDDVGLTAVPVTLSGEWLYADDELTSDA